MSGAEETEDAFIVRLCPSVGRKKESTSIMGADTREQYEKKIHLTAKAQRRKVNAKKSFCAFAVKINFQQQHP